MTAGSTPQTEIDTAQRLRAVFGRLSRALRPTEAGFAAQLTPTRVAVLLTTARHGPIRLSEVAEQEGLNPTLLSRTVASLADAGLLTRTPDPEDRRAAWLESTVAGDQVAAEIRRQRTDAVERALAELTGEQRRAVARALPGLEQLADVLKQDRR